MLLISYSLLGCFLFICNLWNTHNIVSAMNWEEYRSYRSPLSYLHYKNDLVNKRRLKRGKPGAEMPLIAGRLLLDSPQAFDSIREESQNGKRTAKSYQSVGSNDKSTSAGGLKSESQAVADIRQHISYILEQLHNLEQRVSDTNAKVKKDTKGQSKSGASDNKNGKDDKGKQKAKANGHKEDKNVTKEEKHKAKCDKKGKKAESEDDKNEKDKEEKDDGEFFEKEAKESEKKTDDEKQDDDIDDTDDNDDTEDCSENIKKGKKNKKFQHKSTTNSDDDKYNANEALNGKKSGQVSHALFKEDRGQEKLISGDDVQDIQFDDDFIPSLAPYKQLLQSALKDHMEVAGSRSARQNAEAASSKASDLASDFMPNNAEVEAPTTSLAKAVREVQVKVRRWDEWTQWSACSVTCGKGRQIRWRHCVLKDCSEAETEMDEKSCQLPACGSKFLHLFGGT